MGLITPEQYKESLKDGRVVYYEGEKVEDITEHPALKVCIETAAMDYEMAETPEYRDLAVVTHPKTGEPISRYYYTPQNADDLLRRHELMVTATRLGAGVIPFIHDIGADTLNAVNITANMMGKKEYTERAENYRYYLQKNDLSAASAVTDVKGDRMLRPSSPKQAHPDYYVRVIDKDDKGITVRGAKAHITASAYCKELFVIPCRNMTEEDKDYAVAFAIPANTKGIKQICHPITWRLGSLEFPIDLPIRNHTDSLIVFDDVFVPWERVFLCGEWQYAMALVYNFAYLHRHTAASYRIPMSEAMVGAAQAMAEYNGIDKVPHVREKITNLIIYVDTLKSLARASCMDYITHEGIPIPNPVISNIAKYHFAENLHNCIKAIEDIAGGLLITVPTYKDYQNPETKEYIEKYLGGKAGIPTEHRLRMMQLIRRRLATFETEVLALHAEGSLQAQRMTIYGESVPKIQQYKEWAEMAAGIKK
jgi:4-hydroxybutyryl-CoA dehydratase/vinylacetyl-CoA-Delta-isomerase